MENKRHIIKAIADIKRGMVTPKLAGMLKEKYLILRPGGEEMFKRRWNLTDAEYNEVCNYIDKNIGWRKVRPQNSLK